MNGKIGRHRRRRRLRLRGGVHGDHPGYPYPNAAAPRRVTKEMLEAEIGPIAVAPAVLEKMADGETAASPGMKYKHYAPKAQVILVNGDSAAYAAFVNSQPAATPCAMKKTG